MYLRPTNLADSTALEHLFSQVQLALEHDLGGDLIIDLACVAFIRPDGLMALVAAAREWHRCTGRLTRLVKIPRMVHRYLERIDLFTKCAAWLEAEVELAPAERWERSRESYRLLEILPLASDIEQNIQDVQSAVRRAGNILTTWFDADRNAVGRVQTLLSEVASNVVHSQDQGFAVIQRYRDPRNPPNGSQVVLAVADNGIGIEASTKAKLPTPPPVQPGSQFILRALGMLNEPTVAGTGLPRVRTIVREWQGALSIRSFGSMVHLDATKECARDDLVPMPGTQVVISVKGVQEPPF